MAKQNINLGTAPTGAGGDDRRSAWTKAIANFTELYDFLAGAANAASLPASLAAALDNVGGYRRANALGAVSQAGGVPTGAIIEAGSNSSGSYTKFADGTIIMRGVANLDQASMGVKAGSFALPVALAGAYHIVLNITSVNVSNEFKGYARTAATNTTSFQIIHSWDVIQTYGYQWVAFGRWF
ncbi:hypothetical protein ACOKS3_29220 [Pseudomonas sp. HS6-2]|jgi:hypothetical protein|uniref:hypothetical protein n=1 Tax=Pseudomonas sp. HS6-2 TaxID=3410986 RepID=UPI003BC9BC06